MAGFLEFLKANSRILLSLHLHMLSSGFNKMMTNCKSQCFTWLIILYFHPQLMSSSLSEICILPYARKRAFCPLTHHIHADKQHYISHNAMGYAGSCVLGVQVELAVEMKVEMGLRWGWARGLLTVRAGARAVADVTYVMGGRLRLPFLSTRGSGEVNVFCLL